MWSLTINVSFFMQVLESQNISAYVCSRNFVFFIPFFVLFLLKRLTLLVGKMRMKETLQTIPHGSYTCHHTNQNITGIVEYSWIWINTMKMNTWFSHICLTYFWVIKLIESYCPWIRRPLHTFHSAFLSQNPAVNEALSSMYISLELKHMLKYLTS